MSKEKLQFKDVEITFNFKKIPACDQEYLRTMFYETVLDRSVKFSGKTFSEFYPGAGTFTMFNDEKAMKRTMAEYVNEYANTASHLLHGKKYYMAWTFDYNKANDLV